MPDHLGYKRGHGPVQRSGPRSNSPHSSLTPRISGSTRRFISPRRLGCVEARSPGCDGATGTSTRIDCRLRVADKASRAARSKSQPRPQQADGPSISTPTPNRSSPVGAADNATGTRSESTIPSSRTETANPSIPNRSANSSTARHSAADCRESGSRPAAHPRVAPRRSRRTHQGRVGASRSCPSGLHDGDLSTPAPGHGRIGCNQLRRSDCYRQWSIPGGRPERASGDSR